MANPGDHVKIATKDETVEGILMPQKGEFTVVKLESGYNIGIDNKKIKDIKVLSKKEPLTSEVTPVKTNPNFKTISILQTGGTIASKVDYETGGVKANFTPEEIMELFPELKDMANIRFKYIGSIMSENMRFQHYNFIGKEIIKEIEEGTEGIILLHGTDTMHYTSAALSFMIDNLPVPIILAGSQRSSDRGSSDATMNLVSAAHFILNSDFAEVGICMHENTSDDNCIILPGLKARKMHTSRRDAFKAINSTPIARVKYAEKKVEMIAKSYRQKKKVKPILKLFDEKIKVGMLYSHTHMYAEEIKAFKGFDGLVLIGTGLGHFPVINSDKFTAENDKIANAIDEITKKTVTVISSQTVYGRLRLTVYATQRKLQELGVLGDLSDMTAETAFIKLAWLLSNYSKDEARELIGKNLKGEISERTEQETF